MKIYEKFNKMQTALIFPFIFGGVFIALSEILQLIGGLIGSENEIFFYNFANFFNRLLPYVFCYYISVLINEGKRWFNAFWCVLCLSLFITAFNCIYDKQISYIISLLLVLYIYYLFKRLDRNIAIALSIAVSILLGIAYGYVYEYIHDFILQLCSIITGKGIISAILFAIFFTIFSLLGVSDFSDAVFYKSYGGSMLIDDAITTGVKDLFEAGYNGELVSMYLSGHYFFLFALLGIGIAMLSNIKGAQKKVLIFLVIGTLISGNPMLLLLFIFLESPFIFFSSILISVLGYAAAYVLELGIGYQLGGGIVEMLMYLNKPIYLIAGGIVFVAIGFFTFKYCYIKHGISDCYNIYIPTRLNSLVKALGGIKNIIKFKEDYVEVRNPKLIDSISFPCEIKENTVKSENGELNELKEYFNEYT